MRHHDQEHQRRTNTRQHRACLAAVALACLALLAAACSSSPGTGTGAGQPGGSARNSALAYSRCMRSHGITDFPDPNPQGGIAINGSGNGGDLQPSNPKNQAAQKACQPIMDAGQGTPAQQAKNYKANLKYAACMRAHGLINFTDPKPPGSGPVSQGNGGNGGGSGGSGPSYSGSGGVNPNSPQFIAADKACRHYLSGVPGAGPETNSDGGGGS